MASKWIEVDVVGMGKIWINLSQARAVQLEGTARIIFPETHYELTNVSEESLEAIRSALRESCVSLV